MVEIWDQISFPTSGLHCDANRHVVCSNLQHYSRKRRRSQAHSSQGCQQRCLRSPMPASGGKSSLNGGTRTDDTPQSTTCTPGMKTQKILWLLFVIIYVSSFLMDDIIGFIKEIFALFYLNIHFCGQRKGWHILHYHTNLPFITSTSSESATQPKIRSVHSYHANK